MMEINRSCTPSQAQSMRKNLQEAGWTEAKNLEEAKKLEAEGESLVFVDHTNDGKDCFSEAEMRDFRLTPIEKFPEHQKRWGRE